MQIEDGVLVHYTDQNKVAVLSEDVKEIGEWAFSDSNDFRKNPLARIKRTPIEEIVLPASVRIIGKGAFHLQETLKKVVFSEGLEEIRDGAFGYCRALNECVLPDTVQVVSNHVFANCNMLKKVHIPHAIHGCLTPERISPNCISSNLFSKCTLLKDVKIPQGTVTIGKEAFSSCVSLKEISIPDSVQEICDRAFDYCVNLREITLPHSVKTIGRDALPRGENAKLKSIHVSPSNDSYCSVDGVLFTKDMEALVLCPADYEKSVFTVPEGVKEISPGAFEGCKKIRRVVLPDSVAKIGEKAFSRMFKLEKVVLPPSLQELKNEVFAYCIRLKSVTWPKALLRIGDGCFRETGFTTILIPDTVTCIGNYAFAANPYKWGGTIPEELSALCVVPEKVSLPQSVKSLGVSAFYGAKEIEVYDTIDPDATSIAEWIESFNGRFNGALGSVGIYQHEGYTLGACNSTWNDHVIIVKSSADGTIKHQVRMPDGQEDEVRNTFASAWGRNGDFNFRAIDALFDKLTLDAKKDYARERLLHQKDISDTFRAQLHDYISD